MTPDYFKNSILNFSTSEYTDDTGITQSTGSKTTLIVANYKTIDFKKIRTLFQMCPESWFKWIKINNHTNLEKLSQDIYQSPNYWDLILLANNRFPLFEFPYDYDVVELIVDEMVNNYEKYTYKKKLSDEAKERMRLMFTEKVAKDNEVFRYIRYIIPLHLYEFFQLGYENGVFKQE